MSRPTTGDWRLETGDDRRPAVDARARGVSRAPRRRARARLARRDQPPRRSSGCESAARRLRRGFIIVIDYGHPARELYSPTHSAGTLTTFAAHTMAGPERPASAPAWLEDPGDRTSRRTWTSPASEAAAEGAGLTTLGFLDQTYFLLGLLDRRRCRPQDTSGAEDAAHARRAGQHAQSADLRQRCRHTVARAAARSACA